MESITHKMIRQEWRELWFQKVEDDIIDEDVARRDYPLLFVERGTVIRATRDYKHLEIDEILDTHRKRGQDLIQQPNPEVGGWGKFIKTP